LVRFRSKQRGASLWSQQVRVGIFTVLALIAAFLVIVFISDLGVRARGYPIAVHFKDVGLLQEGASVQISGVAVGTVTKIRLLDDQTVEAQAMINKGNRIYRQSQFIVASTLTGQSTLAIRPPVDLANATVLEPGIPNDPNQEPWGVLPPTIGDLVTESQARLRSLDKTIATINEEMPRLAHRFDNIANHTDHLITNADANLTAMSLQLRSTVAELDVVIHSSGQNIVQLTGNINSLVGNNSQRVQQLVDALADTAKNLNTTMANFASLTGDPTIKASLVQTAVNFKDASERLKIAATDLQSLTSDPTVQSELRNTIQNLNGVSAKANDILGNFSSATATTGGAGPAHAPAQPPAGQSGTTPTGSVNPSASLGTTSPNGTAPSSGQKPTASRGFGTRGLTLVEPQVRLYWMNPNTGGGGPSSDLNLTFLPHSQTSVTLGANSLGYGSTYNVLINRRLAPGFTLSGGVLYSNLGVKAVYLPGPVGVDVRLYNSKNPTLDLYGDVRLARQLQLFYGERNLFGPNTKTPTFGLEANF
jgi:phospholipid/cholesterol/gamma-HCH transport system substrate-binding protein